jgi:hypothetical protein
MELTMRWDIKFLEDDKVISVKYQGRSNAELFIRSFEECVGLATKHETNRFLVDTADLEPALTAAEIFELPKAYDKLLVERKTRYAMIQPENPTVRKNLAFFETVCLNRGYLVKLFEDRETAMAWLKA